MDKKVKKLWVDALRSGEYKQAESVLCNKEEDKFCCLGVLCDLHAKTMKKKGFDKYGKYLKQSELLPKTVKNWAGFVGNEAEEYGDNDYDINVRNTTLSQLNDDGKTFEQIADAIEKYL